jgi:DNA adenine methylase
MSTVIQLERQQKRQVKAGPILKWAGGKRRLLPEILPRLPEQFERYFEPFLGGAALYFAVLPQRAMLTDLNAELINVYSCVRDSVEELIEDLKRHRYEREYYYRMRGKDPRRMRDIRRASRMIYLNRTCFNGLYRVNRRGQFNVPFGRYTNPVICQEDRLRVVSQVLQSSQLQTSGYADAVQEAQKGDFIYFDPPYQPITPTANFTSYTSSSFGEQEQRALAAQFAELTERGVSCMLSNSDTPLTRELYADFNLEFIDAPRAISRDPSKRRSVVEILVRNYG